MGHPHTRLKELKCLTDVEVEPNGHKYAIGYIRRSVLLLAMEVVRFPVSPFSGAEAAS